MNAVGNVRSGTFQPGGVFSGPPRFCEMSQLRIFLSRSDRVQESWSYDGITVRWAEPFARLAASTASRTASSETSWSWSQQNAQMFMPVGSDPGGTADAKAKAEEGVDLRDACCIGLDIILGGCLSEIDDLRLWGFCVQR